jgi:GNAT superfamily N-acetyltransferase
VKGALHNLPKGHVGAVVTYLQMTRPPPRQEITQSPLKLEHRPDVGAEAYRSLFRKVGGPWLWFSRLVMDDSELLTNIAELHVVLDEAGKEVGMVEMDFRDPGECLIRFLGLIPALAGHGHGRWLFDQMLALAWRSGVERIRVNTCTLDHPAALRSYLKAGFEPYGRAFESFPDPRLAGILPKNVAPHVPILD